MGTKKRLVLIFGGRNWGSIWESLRCLDPALSSRSSNDCLPTLASSLIRGISVADVLSGAVELSNRT